MIASLARKMGKKGQSGIMFCCVLHTSVSERDVLFYMFSGRDNQCRNSKASLSLWLFCHCLGVRQLVFVSLQARRCRSIPLHGTWWRVFFKFKIPGVSFHFRQTRDTGWPHKCTYILDDSEVSESRWSPQMASASVHQPISHLESICRDAPPNLVDNSIRPNRWYALHTPSTKPACWMGLWMQMVDRKPTLTTVSAPLRDNARHVAVLWWQGMIKVDSVLHQSLYATLSK